MMTMSRGKQILYSVLASLLLHALLMLLVAFAIVASGMFPPEPAKASIPNEVVLYLPELIPEEPEEKEKGTPFMRTSEANRAQSAPENPAFESDKNTMAAAEAEADPASLLPLPSTEGMEKMPFVEIEDREYVDGEMAVDQAAPTSPASRPSMVQPTPLKPTPLKPTPLKPTPLKPKPPAPEPAPPAQLVAAATMPPPPEVSDPGFSDMLDVIETRPPGEPRRLEMTEEAPEVVGEAPPERPLEARQEKAQENPREPVPQQQPAPDTMPSQGIDGFTPHTRKTSIRGTISNRGRASVSAAETPLGRYKAAVGHAIEKLWHRYRVDNADFVVYGNLQLRFQVDRNGNPRNVEIIKNEANAIMADFTLSAILEADIPAMPEEILDILEDESLEVIYDVIIY